jgi:predicted nucleic-acid-binding protein
LQKAFVDTSIIIRLLVKDSEQKYKDVVKLLSGARGQGIALYLLPVAILETVIVLEKVYKLNKNSVAERIAALMNTPDIIIELESVFLKAVKSYVESNVKFADAVMGYWGLDKGIADVFTYDEKDFLRIEGLKVHKP